MIEIDTTSAFIAEWVPVPESAAPASVAPDDFPATSIQHPSARAPEGLYLERYLAVNSVRSGWILEQKGLLSAPIDLSHFTGDVDTGSARVALSAIWRWDYAATVEAEDQEFRGW